MPQKTKLDPTEQAVEEASDAYAPMSAGSRKRVEDILAHSRKSRNVNIRISEQDLEGIKQRANREGVPYQTLISSVLHRYVADQLVDEQHIRRAVGLLREDAPHARRQA